MNKNDVSRLKKENKELHALLKFAFDNLRFVIYDPSEDSEYCDYCVVCKRADGGHNESCGGVLWEERTRQALTGYLAAHGELAGPDKWHKEARHV